MKKDRYNARILSELEKDGRITNADLAEKIGLVDIIEEKDNLIDIANNFAAKIIKSGPKAIAETKKILHSS